MLLINFWTVYFLFFLPVAIKRWLFWSYLWQNKEYRGDKMLDYFSMPESKKVIWDKWIILNIICIFIYILFIYLNSFVEWMYLALIGLWLLETAEQLLKVILGRKILLPKPTSKAILLMVLTFITIILLPLIFSDWLIAWQRLALAIILLLIPLIIGYWILVLFPLDYYVKFRYFQKAMHKRLSLKHLKVIAISGSFGKTTTKEILDQLLSIRFKTEKTIKNQNSNMSCARRTLALKDDTEYFITELGAYKRGDGSEICKFVRPNAAIITGMNYQHFSLFGSEQNIILAESEAVNFLQPGDTVIINWSSELCRKITTPVHLNIIKCAIEAPDIDPNEIDYLVKDIQYNDEGTEFTLVTKKETTKLRTNLLSAGSVQNIIHAIAMCEKAGIEKAVWKEAITKLESPEGRMQVYKTDYGQVIYNEYNNFDGIKNALDLMSHSDKQRIVFIDDILELGSKSLETHLQVAKLLQASNPDLIILLGRSFSNIMYSELTTSGFDAAKIRIWNEQNTVDIKQEVQEFTQSKPSLVLMEGYQSRKFLNHDFLSQKP